MAYILVALTTFQFFLRTIGLHDLAIYLVANPYVLLMPFIFIWLGAAIIVGRSVDRNFLLGWVFILLFPSVMFRTYSGSSDFFFLFLHGMQFFWGPALLVPALLGLFRAFGFVETSTDTARRYLVVLATVAGSITLLELVTVDVLGLSPYTFPWVGSPNDLHPHDIDPFRPWGLPSYPQPNALILAYLFWLSLLYGTNGLYHKIATFVGVALSGSATGQLGFAALLPLVIRRPLLVVALVLTPLILLVGWASLTSQYTVNGGALGRFDVAYAIKLSGMFTSVGTHFFSRFTADEFLFGTSRPDILVITGLTHDWAYLDVFYAYGLVGLVGYILFYGSILFLATPAEVATTRRAYFAIVGLLLNFHYGTLNYFVGQFLFSTLAALQLNRLFSAAAASKSRSTETGAEPAVPQGQLRPLG